MVAATSKSITITFTFDGEEFDLAKVTPQLVLRKLSVCGVTGGTTGKGVTASAVKGTPIDIRQEREAYAKGMDMKAILRHNHEIAVEYAKQIYELAGEAINAVNGCAGTTDDWGELAKVWNELNVYILKQAEPQERDPI